jgi:phage terminase large subunit-like protein
MTISATTFIETVLVDPATGRPFVLTSAQRLFLSYAFALTPDGRMKYPTLCFGAPKKSGKTAFAAMLLLYVVCARGERFAEGISAANDLEQSQSRVFAAAARIVEASPLLAADAVITASKIEFKSTGSTIIAIANDYAGEAGANPNISTFDEPWAFTSEKAHRLVDELVPPPTRRIACRLFVSYAGYEGEPSPLSAIYQRGMAGEQIAPDLYVAGGLLMYWSTSFSAIWQTEEWREEMRQALRPAAYLRLIENRWVTSESTFVDMDWWDQCTDPAAAPVIEDHRLPVYLGVDASTKRDSTAIVACAYDRVVQKVRVVAHRTFQPSPDDPLDFESTIEATISDWARRFQIKEARFDPFQMQASAQRLTARGVPMMEFAQTTGNLTEASSNLYELVKGRNLIVYPDDAIRLAVQRSVAVETSRGWRIAKDKVSHKIDVVVALAQAALGAVASASRPGGLFVSDELRARLRGGAAFVPPSQQPQTPKANAPPGRLHISNSLRARLGSGRVGKF